MKITLARRLAAVLVLAAFAGCSPPKYADYSSFYKDFTVSVPWGWTVLTDQQDDAFTQVNFIGPFDPDFFLGAPSLNVRWYKRYRPHKLADGRLELYSGVDDFVKQMLDQVYGPKYFFLDPSGQPVDKPYEITLRDSGLKAVFFTVLSAAPVSSSVKWGVSLQAGTDKPFVFRKHSYALITMPSGFYVLNYPATNNGYEHYLPAFKELVGSFIPLTDGPGGAKFRIPGPAAK